MFSKLRKLFTRLRPATKSLKPLNISVPIIKNLHDLTAQHSRENAGDVTSSLSKPVLHPNNRDIDKLNNLLTDLGIDETSPSQSLSSKQRSFTIEELDKLGAELARDETNYTNMARKAQYLHEPLIQEKNQLHLLQKRVDLEKKKIELEKALNSNAVLDQLKDARLSFIKNDLQTQLKKKERALNDLEIKEGNLHLEVMSKESPHPLPPQQEDLETQRRELEKALNSNVVLDQLNRAMPNITPHHISPDISSETKADTNDNTNMLQELDNVMENFSNLIADIENPPLYLQNKGI